MERFVTERNVARLTTQLYEEVDPAKQQTLRNLLFAEEHRFGLRSSQVDLVERHTAETSSRIDRQRKLINELDAKAEDTTAARRLLECLLITRTLYEQFRGELLKKLNETRLI